MFRTKRTLTAVFAGIAALTGLVAGPAAASASVPHFSCGGDVNCVPPGFVFDDLHSYVSPNGHNNLYLDTQSGQNYLAVAWGGALPRWRSDFGGQYAVWQHDGNLVVYAAGHVARWSARTNIYCGTDTCTLAVQNDGNVVVYNAQRTAVWSTHTQNH